MSSPLRFAGGKSRAMAYLDQFMPDDVAQYREPFIGGGSAAFHVAARYPHSSIWINDAHKPLATFWRVLRDQPTALIATLLTIHHDTQAEADARKSFAAARQALTDNDHLSEVTLAAQFYVWNRLGFSGAANAGFSSSHHHRWLGAGKRIAGLTGVSAKMQGWTITNLDYADVLRQPGDAFVFCDPPYPLAHNNLYVGHSGFDHARFVAEALAAGSAGGRMMVTYAESMQPQFAAWPRNQTWSLAYCMQSNRAYRANQAQRLELLSCSYR